LLAATLLTGAAAVFLLLALLTLLFLSFATLLSALSGRGRFVWLIWILLCVHDAFLIVELLFEAFALGRLGLCNPIVMESGLD
jgi:hypothetical protein